MIKTLIKLLGYFTVGVLSLLIILFYRKGFSLYPWNYAFKLYDLYFGVNLFLLPAFRVIHSSWFKAKNDQIITYKQRALEAHHRDMAQSHTNRKWSVNGVSANPWEYTMSETSTYGHAAGWAYNLVKSIFISLLFIIFSPIFYAVSFKKGYRKLLK